jgi:murein L,D-transpeptidase YcbB/YkuD
MRIYFTKGGGMSRKFFVFALTVFAIISITVSGCKGKVEKPAEESIVETTATDTAPQPGDMLAAQTIAQQTIVEPAQSVATETIPPTAAAGQVAGKAQLAVAPATDRNKDIQTALKNAGFYNGSVDGKIGPKTKSAIQDFQKAKGLKADGKVGPKTWAEMEKYLLKQ